jgi:hypothetical protein
MPRPFCKRFVGWQPHVALFKPAGIPAGELEIVESARRKVADALVHGKALQIQTEPGAQPPPAALAPGACHRRGCGCQGHGRGHGRYVEYPHKGESK